MPWGPGGPGGPGGPNGPGGPGGPGGPSGPGGPGGPCGPGCEKIIGKRTPRRRKCCTKTKHAFRRSRIHFNHSQRAHLPVGPLAEEHFTKDPLNDSGSSKNIRQNGTLLQVKKTLKSDSPNRNDELWRSAHKRISVFDATSRKINRNMHLFRSETQENCIVAHVLKSFNEEEKKKLG